jgi:hypothetical protein
MKISQAVELAMSESIEYDTNMVVIKDLLSEEPEPYEYCVLDIVKELFPKHEMIFVF